MVGLPLNKPSGEHATYDLGWVIQNQQISDEELCSYLLDDVSPEIDRLVYRFMKSPADRIAAVDQIIFTLLRNRRRYKSNMSGKAWLYQLILDECLKKVRQGSVHKRYAIRQVLKAIDTQPAGETHFSQLMDSYTVSQRLFAVLHFGQNLSAEEIAHLVIMPKETIQADLTQLRQSMLAHLRSCEECSTIYSSLTGMEAALSSALQTHHNLIETTRDNRSDWANSILNRLDRAKTSQRNRRWASRIAEFGLLVIFLVIGELAIGQSWPFPPQETRPTETVVRLVASEKSTPEPAPAFTPTPLPLAAEIDPERAMEDILSLSLTSWARWQTLWADVEVKTYKTESYSDGAASIPGDLIRKQIWLTLPGYSRVMSGAPSGNPDITYSINDQKMYGQNFNNGQIITGSTSELIPDEELRRMFSPIDMFPSGGKFNRIGSDAIAGRPTWVLDWSSNGHRNFRFWIDQKYGVVLRRLEFGPELFQPVVSNITVTKIFFDANIPAAIYEPDRYKGDHFAYDFSGDPVLLDLKSVLASWSNPGINFSRKQNSSPISNSYATSHLYFLNVPAGGIQRDEGPGLELFADYTDLGKLPLGGKSILSCERSPDGSRIAYNSPPIDGSGDSMLLVADLASIQSARPALLGGITAGDFAFSPDNTRLAFFGCEKASGFCGIFVLDLTSWKLTRLTPMTYADYLFWASDGHSIALVGKDDLSASSAKLATANLLMNEAMALLHPWYFQVIDASNGDVAFKRSFDWSNLSAPPDSPTKNWNTPFKISATGTVGCVQSPANSSSR